MFFELSPGQVLTGQKDRYVIVATLKAGTQGVTFRAVRQSDGRAVTVKSPAVELDSDLTPEEIQRTLGQISASFQSDFEALQRLEAVDCVAHVLDYGTTLVEIAGHQYFLLFIVYRLIDGPQLDEFAAQRYAGTASFAGVQTARSFFDLALELARVVLHVHRNFVVHGDIWPANILVEDERQVLVDFGQATLRDHAFVRPTRHRRQTYPYVAPEGSGTIGADIYSLGGVLFFLATGAPPTPNDTNPHSHVTASKRRREIVRRIEALNPTLHRSNYGIAEVIAKCLMPSPLDRPKAVEDVVGALELFAPERHVPTAPVQSISLDVGSPVLRLLLEFEVRRVQRIAADMAHGMYDLIGDTDDVMSGLTAYLAQVGTDKANDLAYITITTGPFWLQDEVCGGTFMAMNKELARRGAVRRIFLLTRDELADPRIRIALRAHAKAVREFPIGRGTTEVGLPDPEDLNLSGYWAAIVLMDGEEIAAAVNEIHIGLLRRDGLWTTLVPLYADDTRVAGLQFRAGERATRDAERLLERYRKLAVDAVPLDELDLGDDSD